MNARLLVLASALALGACVAGPAPEIDTSLPALPERFAFAPDATTGESLAALLPSEDPAFRGLTALALTDAPTLAEAVARIEIARAGVARTGAERLPSIGGTTFSSSYKPET